MFRVESSGKRDGELEAVVIQFPELQSGTLQPEVMLQGSSCGCADHPRWINPARASDPEDRVGATTLLSAALQATSQG